MKYTLILVLFIIVNCNNNSNMIKTIAIVTPKNYRGNICIFFNQDTNIGKIQIIGNKHYFIVDNSNSVFFTKKNISEGFIEYYIKSNNKFDKINYCSSMLINEANDYSYQIIGGSYRGFKSIYWRDGKEWLNFISFKGDLALNLKNELEVKYDTIESMYKNP